MPLHATRPLVPPAERSRMSRDVFELLHDEPRTALQLAAILGKKPRVVRLLLVHLVAIGVAQAIATSLRVGSRQIVWSLTPHGRFHHEMPDRLCRACRFVHRHPAR